MRGSEFPTDDRELGRPEAPPLGKCHGAVDLEIVPWAEGSLQVEGAVDDRMDGGAFLEASHPPETEHCVFASPERQL